MMLEEANARLKKGQITEEQLWQINSLYILLDLDKSDFCKIVDAVGLDTLIKKQKHYDRLLSAESELAAKERYMQAKQTRDDALSAAETAKRVIDEYENKMRTMCRG